MEARLERLIEAIQSDLGMAAVTLAAIVLAIAWLVQP